MRRFAMLLGMAVLAVAVAGCASGQKRSGATPSTTTRPAATAHAREAVRLTYPAVGVNLTAAPSGYRPAVSRSEVLALFRKTGDGSLAKGRPTVHLWKVGDGRPRSGYPAWVITFHDQRPISYGVGSVLQKPGCVFVAIYNLRARVWTWFFQTCPNKMPSRPSCGYGCTPANQSALDAAAHAVERVVGQAYYTGVVVNDPSNTVTVYLAHAPQSILHRLNAVHPGIYVIHNDAPRPLRDVMKAMRSLDTKALKAQGINVTGYGPTQDGYLQVGVTGNVAKAQARLNTIYGHNVIHVVKQAPAIGF